MTSDVRALFSRIPLFDGLSDADFGELIGCVEPRSVRGGRVVFREGEAGHAAYVIERGHVRLTQMVDGHPRTLSELGPGELFGELLLLDGAPYRATAVALEDVDLLALDRARFVQLRADLRPVAFHVLQYLARVLAQRIDDTERQIKAAVAHEPARPDPPAKSWFARIFQRGN